MTDGEQSTTETAILRLSDALQGFREADLWCYLKLTSEDAETHVKREEVRAVVQTMLSGNRLRRFDGRYWKVRA